MAIEITLMLHGKYTHALAVNVSITIFRDEDKMETGRFVSYIHSSYFLDENSETVTSENWCS